METKIKKYVAIAFVLLIALNTFGFVFKLVNPFVDIKPILHYLNWGSNFIVAIIIFSDKKNFHIPKSIFILILAVTLFGFMTGIVLLLLAEFFYENFGKENL